ncbi:SRPBCC family protein (plasmid) [Rhodococcus pyridinivorans]|uniref:SRPBCC family protein n=1 Tax=Rhodococcus TaxID=1827 RepID=UPI0007DA2BE8|nr:MULTISPECIES: SRPBCC family protein [Rhodococcus]MCT7293673.1 SRPBCC family protein [Rhodococcus sp. PAE-6]QXU56454.1 SRPBCC family protein [Rhodococcus sp. LW-XY12]UQB75823.1 SRPBCC family protein [Rhodococcus ruber]UVT27513.1 SRPBCC family protein [Rhodococcus pyridinivorans]WML66324.1 SRPBCC family protein [Rhodococcus sp. AH-ZY2]
MPFTIARTLDAPIDRVFDWLADATNYLAALPITRVDLTGPGSTEPSGVGSRRTICAAGVEFDEVVTEFARPIRISYTVEKTRPRLPHRGATVSLTETPKGTRVRWRLDTRIDVPVVGPLAGFLLGALLAPGFLFILAAAQRSLNAERIRP